MEKSQYGSFFPELDFGATPDISLALTKSKSNVEDRASLQSLQPLIEREIPQQKSNTRRRNWKADRPLEQLFLFSGHFEDGKPGWWKKQVLVDRSLRSMTGFVLICTLIMIIIIFSYMKDFMNRINKNSTSVGGRIVESCNVLERKSVVRTRPLCSVTVSPIPFSLLTNMENR